MASDVAQELAELRGKLDAEATPLSPVESVLLRRRIGASVGSRRRRRFVRGGLLLAAAAAVVALAVRAVPSAEVEDASWYRAARNAGCLSEPAAGVVAAGACTAEISVGGDAVELERGTELLREEAALAVRRGAATFEVRKRAPGEAPFRVRVSGGTIVVLGTRFRVVQRDDGGVVTLERGRIAFEARTGERIELEAGETLAWPIEEPPRAAEPPSDAQEDESAPSPSAADAVRRTVRAGAERAAATREDPAGPAIGEVMRRMFQLRSQHRYREAARLLRANEARADLSPAQRARLGFELAVLLDEQLGDRAAACRQYRAHAERYPNDTLRRARVERALEACP